MKNSYYNPYTGNDEQMETYFCFDKVLTIPEAPSECVLICCNIAQMIFNAQYTSKSELSEYINILRTICLPNEAKLFLMYYVKDINPQNNKPYKYGITLDTSNISILKDAFIKIYNSRYLFSAVKVKYTKQSQAQKNSSECVLT